jgi:HD-like signal output (HDOD) protein
VSEEFHSFAFAGASGCSFIGEPSSHSGQSAIRLKDRWEMLWKRVRDRMALATGDFARVFAHMEIPPLPQVALKAVQTAQQDDYDIEQLSELLATDTGITSRILRLVNSSYCGTRNPVRDIRQGVVLLGAKRISSLVLGLVTSDLLPRKAPGFDPIEFWQQSIQRALFAQSLAARISPGSQGEAFTAALLQDMALPILLTEWGEHYLPLVNLAKETGKELIDVEDEQLTWNHAQAGAWMARNWGFLDVLVCGIGLHHYTLEQFESLGLLDSPVMAVAVSARLPEAELICCEALRLNSAIYRDVCATTDAACGEIADLFSVPQPQPLLQIAGSR